ncbi:MAG: cytidine deaminase [Thermomicrobiales bacterium]
MTTLDASRQRTLLERARLAARNAYVPYSEFPVGAAVLTDDGSIYSGANIENASYGLTVCGERSAVFAAASAGQRTIVAVAVSAPKLALTSPCGACRQVLSEFRPKSGDMDVILDDRQDGEVVTLGDLLPRAFGPRTLDESKQAETRTATNGSNSAR